ncbi:MAG: epoxyqueuosine reductase QueH [Fibrobacterota bacterium]
MNNKILLHCCCAPDTTYSAPFFKETENTEVDLFFPNSNIHPENEFHKRLEALEKVSEKLCFRIKGFIYEPGEWDEAVKGLENEPEKGLRCRECFRYLLKKTAEEAKVSEYAAFATTLTISPHKDADLINSIGEEIAGATGVKYIPSNLKKKGGFKESVRISGELGIYRQNFCGCRYSMKGQR